MTPETYPNIALIVLDSLRYDVAMSADTPNLNETMAAANAGTWRKCFAQATYTLPSILSMVHAGMLPDNRDSPEPIYNRSIQGLMRGESHLHGKRNTLYSLPKCGHIADGWAKLGYLCYCVGGVRWFDQDEETARLWQQYFRVLWTPSFGENNPTSLQEQIKALQCDLPHRAEEEPRKIFLLWNVATTHWPYAMDPSSVSQRKPIHKDFQRQALQEVDKLWPEMLGCLDRRRPWHIVLCADHGECFGEDGLYGHAFYHPKVMEVPMVHFLLTPED